MATLTLQLANGQTFPLPKQWILDFLPESLLADALRNEPDLTYLQIQQPVVTPEVMQVLVNLSQGIEPTETLTEPVSSQIQAADRYLNIPAALVYTRPYYDEYVRSNDAGGLKNTAISHDDAPLYRYLLSKGAQSNYDDLLTAVIHNARQVMAYLLTLPSVNPFPDGDIHLLIEAIYRNRPEILRMLLADPRVDPHISISNNGQVLLLRAVADWNLPVLQLLLQDGRVDPIPLVLESAVQEGYLPIVQLLLRDGRVDPTANQYEALNQAAMQGDADIVRLFLADPRVDPSKSEALYRSLAAYPDIVRLLLADPRVDPTVDDNGVLIQAIIHGWNDIIALFLADPRVDPSLNDNIALMDAINSDNFDAVKLLLADPRIDPTANDNVAVRHAFKKRLVDMYRLLVADPRIKASLGEDQIRAQHWWLGINYDG